MGLFSRLGSHGSRFAATAPGSMFERREHFRLTDPRNGWASVETAELPALRLGRVVSTGHKVVLSESDQMTVLLPVRGRLGSETAREAHTAAAGQALIFSPNRRSTEVDPGGHPTFEALVLLLTPLALMAAAEQFDAKLARQIKYAEIAHTFGRGKSAGAIARVSKIIQDLVAEIERDDTILSRERARVTMMHFVFELLLGMMDTSGVFEQPGRGVDPLTARRMRLAEDYMQANFGEITSIQEVAAAIDVSVRLLQLSFMKHGDSPRARLNRIRIDAARERLLRPREMDTVSVIAFECGFSHLGRFSQAYRATFRETPAVTLKRARAGR